jgi:EAL domain-containing protein (putative c-di-GMP-specific phosphodiesterase class I)
MRDDGEIRRTYLPAATIFKEGAPGDAAFVIERGRVELSVVRDGRSHAVAELGPGEIFGETALLDDTLRATTAVALAETETIVFNRTRVLRRLSTLDPVIALLLRLVLARLQALQRNLADLPANETVIRDPAVPAAAAMAAFEEARELLTFEHELEAAIRGQQFRLELQPIVNLQTRRTLGYEALIRWDHPVRGPVPPMEFVALAEETGVIAPIDRWLFRTAFALAARMQAEHAGSGHCPYLSVNLSARRCSDPDLAGDLQDALNATGADPRGIKVEVTETALIEQPHSAALTLRQLREVGFSIVLDDFGTGYSSLSYLHRFPIDTLKIDQSFVRSLFTGGSSPKIVRAIVGLAEALGMSVVAEGVETEEEAAALVRIGCSAAQGYLFSHPLPPEEAFAFGRRSGIAAAPASSSPSERGGAGGPGTGG